MFHDGARKKAGYRGYMNHPCNTHAIEIQPELLLQKIFSRVLNKEIIRVIIESVTWIEVFGIRDLCLKRVNPRLDTIFTLKSCSWYIDTPTEFRDETTAKIIAVNGILLLLSLDNKSPDEFFKYSASNQFLT